MKTDLNWLFNAFAFWESVVAVTPDGILRGGIVELSLRRDLMYPQKVFGFSSRLVPMTSFT